MNLKLLGICALLALHGIARAENGCPAGYQPWRIPMESSNDCAPIPDYGAPPPPPRQTAWSDAWATVVWFHKKGGGGGYVYTAGQLHQSDSERIAMEKCRSAGGIECRIALSGKNGVMAIAKDKSGAMWVNGASTTRDAKASVLDACNKDQGTKCKVVKTIKSEAWLYYTD